MAAVAQSSDEAKERMRTFLAGPRRQGPAMSELAANHRHRRPPGCCVRRPQTCGRPPRSGATWAGWPSTAASTSPTTTRCTRGRSAISRGSGRRSGSSSDVSAHTPATAVLGAAGDAGRRVVPRRDPQLRRARAARSPASRPTTSRSSAYSQTREPVQLTWAQLREQVARARAGLARLGVGRGDRVVAYLPNIPETVVAFLATASLGAVWASCAPEFGARSVVDRFGQIEPTVLLAVSGYGYGSKDIDRREQVAEIRAGLPTVRHVVHVPYGPDPLPDTVDWAELLAGPGQAGPDAEFDPGAVRPPAVRAVLLRHDRQAEGDRARPRRDPARAPEEPRAELGPAPGRPHPLVLHDRVDDVERAGLRAAGRRVDRADRRQPAAPRPGLAVAAGRRDRRDADGREPRVPHGLPRGRACGPRPSTTCRGCGRSARRAARCPRRDTAGWPSSSGRTCCSTWAAAAPTSAPGSCRAARCSRCGSARSPARPSGSTRRRSTRRATRSSASSASW